MKLTRRRALVGVSVVLLSALAAAGVYLARVAPIVVAYKAKMLCSEVFVGGREPRAVLADLEADDLAPLRYIATSIDSATQSVTATGLSVVTRRAVHQNGRGCTISFGADVPRELQTPSGHDSSRTIDESPEDAELLLDAPPNPALEGVIDRAFAEPDPQRLRRTRAIVVVHKGHVVAERYATGFTATTPVLGWSMAKSVMNALVGILVKNGRLSLDRPVAIPEWQGTGDPRREITLDHLLRMSSGLRFDEGMTSPLTDVTYMLLDTGDASGFAMAKALDVAPGVRWQYSSGTTNIIARVLRNVFNDDRAYYAFPRRALFDRLGMTNAVIETDAAGTFIGSSFMYATARDWARLGILYLQDGIWHGERILPEGWVAYSRSPTSQSAGRYGAHFWVEGDMFQAAGHEGQFVTIVPSRDTVIVRLGLTRYGDAWDHPGFVRDVLGSLGDSTHSSN